MMFYLGVDVGSLSCDAVLIDDAAGVVSWSVVPTGARNSAAIKRARREVLEAADVAAEELNQDGVFFGFEPEQRERSPAPTHQPLGGNHLGHHGWTAQLARHAAVGRIGDAGHGRQQHRRIDVEVCHLHARCIVVGTRNRGNPFTL